MSKTGPQKIPGASQAYFYGTGRYSGSDMEVNCGVVHTTEGMNLPSYNGGSMAPTVTGVPNIKDRTIRWYQHFDVDESARALANKLGEVETNTANVFQIELVGTCDDKYAKTWSGKRAGVDYLHWPTAPDWALAEVAWLVRWLNQHHGIPLTCVKDWLAYGKDSRRPGVTPASYGANPARMTFAQWRTFKGWCGHQHVPENDHGDPGAMNFARVIQLAKGDEKPAAGGTYTVKSGDTLSRIGDALGVPWPDIATANRITSPYRITPGQKLTIPKAASAPAPSKPPTTPTESDMKLSDQVTIGDWVKKQWPADKGLQDGKIAVNTALGSGYAHSRRAAENTDAILKQLEALRTEVAQLRAAVTKGA
ncbi:predicted protein [Streptomyces viridosporus ATCC 14672]|uniref:Predicted protein n=1 Tax=Streptomyces viridosporus (strain ATCC 14672 / DSM 40746 / JCM 4963 / KCTC 9882 / NRRL B-12104 / FH 1290) TaxID=566461 RepID=D6A4A6_STRV1|nr:LysM domain-containing protein [Streptomyces viridosporus]EFE65746.1 predicted protein [Streptomyces viridosporus ATCC 14672]